MNWTIVISKNKMVKRIEIIIVSVAFCRLSLFVSKIKLYGLNFLSFSNWEINAAEYTNVHVKIPAVIFFFVRLLKNNVSEITNK